MLKSTISSAIDSYLSYVIGGGLNCYPENSVPAEMRAAGDVDSDEGLVAWSPVPSRVGKPDVARLQTCLGVELSPQFVELLSYKHFMELHLGDMWFFAHPMLGWQEVLTGQVFEGFPRELLFDKGFLPFASWSDWGRYCFRLDMRHSNGEYDIYQWDHDDPTNFLFVAESFNDAVEAAMSR